MLHKYSLHWTIHPNRDEAWYEKKKRGMTADEVAQELDINYAGSVTGKVFESFTTRKHLSEKPFKVNIHKPVYRIWDFGRVNCVLYGQIDEYGRRRVMHERVLEKSSTPEQIAVALEDSRTLFNQCRFVDICDPAGSYDDERGKDTDVEMMEAEGINPQYHDIIAMPTKDRKARARKMLMRDLEMSPGGDDAFQIYVNPERTEGAPTLLRAFQGGYAWKKDRNKNILDVIDERHPFEDVIDCVLYWYLETKQVIDDDPDLYKPISASGTRNPYTGY